MCKNTNLAEAKKNKNDEFYTQLSDIEKELAHYTDKLKDKIIYCNCDNPEWSNFYKYFKDNFATLGIKQLISTFYSDTEKTYKTTYDGKDEIKKPLKGNGDFRSNECLDILKESDIVITNPPFSLFRNFIAVLMEYEKQFLIIGNMNAVTYNEVFPLIKDNKVWFGKTIHSGDREFRVPENYPLDAAGCRIDSEGNKYIRVKGVRWFTNIKYNDLYTKLELIQKFDSKKYAEFDKYKAINIDKTKDIPSDYDGAMGVPITFLDKYNPKQFKILNANDIRKDKNILEKKHGLIKDKDASVNKLNKYVRIVIQRIPEGGAVNE